MKRIKKHGADVIAAIAAKGLELAVPGTGAVGALAVVGAGRLLSSTIEKLGADANERALSPMEHARMGIVLTFLSSELQRRIEMNYPLRGDEFFEGAGHYRSDAEEIAEDLLRKVRDEPEERKLIYMANLGAEVCFNPEISKNFAHSLLKLADSLSYRQLVMLRIYHDKSGNVYKPKNDIELSRAPSSYISILLDILELDQLGLIENLDFATLSYDTALPWSMAVVSLGTSLFLYMRLREIPELDADQIISDINIDIIKLDDEFFDDGRPD